MWGGVGRPSPLVEEGNAPSHKCFRDLKMSTSSAFWALFLQFSCLLYKHKTLLLGLQNSLRICLHAAPQLPAVFQAFYDLLMNTRSFTSQTRRVFHGHDRHLIPTGRTIDQVSIARPPTGACPPGSGLDPPLIGTKIRWPRMTLNGVMAV